jgi:hypothetical protein
MDKALFVALAGISASPGYRRALAWQYQRERAAHRVCGDNVARYLSWCRRNGYADPSDTDVQIVYSGKDW